MRVLVGFGISFHVTFEFGLDLDQNKKKWIKVPGEIDSFLKTDQNTVNSAQATPMNSQRTTAGF